MEEEKIAVNKSMCNAEADATLTVTLDTLGAISSRKLLIGSSRTHAKLNFLVKLISPKGTVLLDEEHDVDQEKLDDLADKTASVINKKVRPFF